MSTASATSEQALAEAAAWVVKLHGPGRDHALVRAWRVWVEDDPSHLHAWEVTSDAWERSHDLPIGLVLPAARRKKRSSRGVFFRAAIPVAICVLMVSVAVFIFNSGTAVSTQLGEQKTLSLRDGTRVELNTKTRLAVEYDKHVRRVVLKSGEAYFSVAHETRPFVVVAGDRKVFALGTTFMVRRGERGTEDSVVVTLIEGRVAVAPKGSVDELSQVPPPQLTVLKSGQRLKVRLNGHATVDSPSMDRETGWMRGQVIFDHTALREAAEELNRYSNLRIEVSAAAADIPVGGVVRVGDSESFARAVAETYGLVLAREGTQLRLDREQPSGGSTTN